MLNDDEERLREKKGAERVRKMQQPKTESR